jgi:EAL domain-containing protein (putative c-di-GMP-specific phosphodiesterase class I)
MIDENGDIIPPYQFLDIAKTTKQYIAITKKVIQKATETFKNSSKEFAINITIEDILSSELNNYTREMLGKEVYKGRIVLEVVESESIESFDEVTEFIARAKQCGCKIAIDDFGTGYSNFEYLIKLRADYIKIDGSMIKNIDKDIDCEEIVRTIVDFAKKRKLKTIAEFVCSKEVFDKVVELGIDYSQGYYIGKPEPVIAS